ncbi:hypothetical protein [Lunatimonas sp.]|uniref:hypothetical protein n=1 Tax=Lunatimonas sp. TaxID=2060141 RepID=UPI00263B3425|nr:hypothetical protein [Lunatimonas sp.]
MKRIDLLRMYKKATLLVFVCLWALSLSAQISKPTNLWAVFGQTRFVEKLNREHALYYLYPIFQQGLKDLEGKEVELVGFHIPLEVSSAEMLILSKFPMAECFFCGQSGPESVAVVYLKEKPGRRLKMDQVIKVTGILVLNDSDVNELNFILKNARIIGYE